MACDARVTAKADLKKHSICIHNNSCDEIYISTGDFAVVDVGDEMLLSRTV